ncbi:hypothetical protein MRX96_039132 [Rhipicephalus microplus]
MVIVRRERKAFIADIAHYSRVVAPIMKHNIADVISKLRLISTGVITDMLQVLSIEKESKRLVGSLRRDADVLWWLLINRKYGSAHPQNPALRSARALAKRARLFKPRHPTARRARDDGTVRSARKEISP